MSLVEIKTDGPVRTVTLNRPEKRNAINPDMMGQLLAAFETTPPDSERVTVLRANGSVFSAGLQLSTAGVDPGEAARIEAMFNAVQHYPLPVIAAVQGAAIAGGCELALHCDFIVAKDSAPIQMPLAQIGVTTTWFLTKKLMEFAGPTTTRELLLLGEPLTGARLHELGVVTRSCAADEIDATVTRLATRLSANAPLAMRMMKKLIIRQMSFLLDAVPHEDLDQEVAAVYASVDAVEGVAAKVERREPNFKGQ